MIGSKNKCGRGKRASVYVLMCFRSQAAFFSFALFMPTKFDKTLKSPINQRQNACNLVFVWFPIICFRRQRTVFFFFICKFGFSSGCKLSHLARVRSFCHFKSKSIKPTESFSNFLSFHFLSMFLQPPFYSSFAVVSPFHLILIAMHLRRINLSRGRADYSYRTKKRKQATKCVFFLFFFFDFDNEYDSRDILKQKRRRFVLKFVARHI